MLSISIYSAARCQEEQESHLGGGGECGLQGRLSERGLHGRGADTRRKVWERLRFQMCGRGRPEDLRALWAPLTCPHRLPCSHIPLSQGAEGFWGVSSGTPSHWTSDWCTQPWMGGPDKERRQVFAPCSQAVLRTVVQAPVKGLLPLEVPTLSPPLQSCPSAPLHHPPILARVPPLHSRHMGSPGH